MLSRRIFNMTLPGITILGGSPSYAETFDPPAGDPILTISGRISRTNSGDRAMFDRDMLEALGVTSFKTNTPWYSSVVTFEGVKMTTLMDRVQAKGELLMVTALNDYTSDIPIEDFVRYEPILALKRDGKYMAISDKGPLFIVYPYDKVPELRSQRFYSRSAWQIARMEVR